MKKIEKLELQERAEAFVVTAENLKNCDLKNEQAIFFIYTLLKLRKIHPIGEFDSKKRWYPTHGECCTASREPSAAYPFSLMLGCRTLVYVENCVNKAELDDVSVSNVYNAI